MSELATTIDEALDDEPQNDQPKPLFKMERKWDLGELYSRVALALERAKLLMNDDGSHWTTGTLAVEQTLGVQRFCAVGGMNAALGLDQKYIADWINTGPYGEEIGERGYSFHYLGKAAQESDESFADILDVRSVALHLLSQVIDGVTEIEVVTPDTPGFWSETTEREGRVISMNDGAREMQERVGDRFFSVTLDNATAYNRVASRFTAAVSEAVSIAQSNGVPYFELQDKLNAVRREVEESKATDQNEADDPAFD